MARLRKGIPPEGELLLCWALPAMPEGAKRRLDDLLGQELDWARFARFAVRHGLAPLVGHHLLKSTDSRIPKAVRSAFAELEQANARRNMRLTGELLLILRAFTTAGVRAISLKGPALAMQADKSVGLRIIADLDLLVAPHDLSAAHMILRARNYALSRAYDFTQSDDVFVRRNDNSIVELHRRLGEPWWPLPLALVDVLGDPAEVMLSGWRVPILQPQDNLIYLSFHAARHGWSRLAWLTAAYGLFVSHRDAIEHPAFAARVERLGMAPAVGTTFALMRRLLDAPPFAPVLERLSQSRAVSRLATAALSELFEEQETIVQTDPVASAVALLAAAAGADTAADARLKAMLNIRVARPQIVHALRRHYLLGGDAPRYLLRFLFSATPEDITRLRVPARYRVFYAVARPVMLIERFGRAIVARASVKRWRGVRPRP